MTNPNGSAFVQQRCLRSRGVGSTCLVAAVLAAVALASCGPGDPTSVERSEASCEVKPSTEFQRRIEPLLTSDRPTTCNQCHLSGVDLTAFVRETPCQTWACLVDQGLVDVDFPAKSRILDWISRASPESELITEEVIAEERDGFLGWIEANAACPTACVGVTCGDVDEGPTCSDGTVDEPPPLPDEEDARGCSDVEIEQAFFDDVYAWRGRCYPCHFDTNLTADADAPRWISLAGNCSTGSAVTLKRALGLGLIDVSEPHDSLLLLKPLNDTAGGVKHGGDQKFASTMDPTYRSFLRFIEHYSSCQSAEEP